MSWHRFLSVLDADNFEMELSEAQRKEFCLSNYCAVECYVHAGMT